MKINVPHNPLAKSSMCGIEWGSEVVETLRWRNCHIDAKAKEFTMGTMSNSVDYWPLAEGRIIPYCNMCSKSYFVIWYLAGLSLHGVGRVGRLALLMRCLTECNILSVCWENVVIWGNFRKIAQKFLSIGNAELIPVEMYFDIKFFMSLLLSVNVFGDMFTDKLNCMRKSVPNMGVFTFAGINIQKNFAWSPKFSEWKG